MISHRRGGLHGWQSTLKVHARRKKSCHLAPSLAMASSTASIIQDWQSEPDYRGTFSIVSTCISTYIICVWTANYVDVSPRKCDFWISLRRRLRGGFTGFITPTNLMRIAASQRYSAICLSRDAYTFLDDLPSPSPLPGLFGRLFPLRSSSASTVSDVMMQVSLARFISHAIPK